MTNSVNCADAGSARTCRRPVGITRASDHGTHVAGTIAAARNGIGIVGVAPNVRIASVKVINADGFIYPEYAVCGFVWAGLKHMDVTNNSYFVDPFEYYCEDQPDQYAAKEACAAPSTGRPARVSSTQPPPATRAHDLADKHDGHRLRPTTAWRSPGRINSGCEDIPTELDGVVTVSARCSVPTGHPGSCLSSFSQPRPRGHRRRRPRPTILSTLVKGQRLWAAERHVHGVSRTSPGCSP